MKVLPLAEPGAARGPRESWTICRAAHQSQSKQNTMIKAADAFSEKRQPKVSLVGMDNIVDKHQKITRRLVWTTVMASATALMVYQVSHCLARYAEYPVSSVMRVIRNDTLLLPAITVCNNIKYIMSLYKSRTNGTLDIFRLDWETLGPETMRNFLQTATPSLQNVITKCQLDDRSCDEVGRWEETLKFRLGRCFSFYPAADHATSPHISAGYRLSLRTAEDQGNGFQMVTKTKPGWKVFVHGVHDPLTLKTWITVNRPIELASGESRQEAITPHQVRTLDRADSRCQSAANYSAVRCMERCLAYWVVRTSHNCRTVDMDIEAAPCANYTAYTENQYRVDEDSAYDTEHVDDCSRRCPQRCDVTNFVTKEIDTRTNRFWLNKGKLHLFFASKEVILREEKWAYEATALIGEVGGSLGITLGLSLLTVVEIIDFVCLSLVKLCRSAAPAQVASAQQ